MIKKILNVSAARWFVVGSTTFVIDVVDAPGLISSVEVKLSNSVQPEDLGAAVVTLGSAENQSVGSVSVTYTAGDVAGDEDIEITIFDGQDPAKPISFNKGRRSSSLYGFPVSSAMRLKNAFTVLL